MAKIKDIKSTEILDAKGYPTIETTVTLSDGATASASVPSGTSIGSYEAMELRDNDTNRFGGKGVLKVVQNVQTIIAPKLLGLEANNQQEVDKTMIDLDGTQNKARLGANAILSVSMAVCKAAAKSSVLPLFLYIRQFIRKENLVLKIPTPLFNLVNGGMHAGGNLDFQEFLLVPSTAKTFDQSLEISDEVYQALKVKLKDLNVLPATGDEGGFAPSFPANVDAFAVLKQAIQATPYQIGFDVFFGLDAASNNLYRQQHYTIRDKSMSFSSTDLITYYEELNKQYQLLYLEDPLAEDDWEAWTKLTEKMGGNILIVGDDLTVTNPYRLQTAIAKKAITGIVIKPNQIGTVIETLAVVEVARSAGLKIIVSNRSGETNDDFIADFAVAVSADYVKFGAPARGERVAKYNRLSQIEKQLAVLAAQGTT